MKIGIVSIELSFLLLQVCSQSHAITIDSSFIVGDFKNGLDLNRYAHLQWLENICFDFVIKRKEPAQIGMEAGLVVCFLTILQKFASIQPCKRDPKRPPSCVQL
jgi:hypothetical protein